MLFQKKLQPGDFVVQEEGNQDILHINYEGFPYVPSIEDDALCMGKVIEIIAQSPTVARIVFHQQKKFEYNETQTRALVEVAGVYNYFIKQKKFLTQAALEVYGAIGDSQLRLRNLQYLILNLLKNDPIGAYVEATRFLREEKIDLEKGSEDYRIKIKPYLDLLLELHDMLVKSHLIVHVSDKLAGYQIGTRELYRNIFRPIITPDFMYTRYLITPPLDGLELDAYSAGKKTKVQIYETKATIKPLYFIIPSEFQLSEDKAELLDLARKVLSEHQPKAEEFLEPDRMRQNFFNIGRDLLTELASHKNFDLTYKELEEMAEILVRYTVGFGIIESILEDPNVQDININSPPGSTPIFLVHSKFGECVTNIIPSVEDIDGWASKFRLISTRPLDEANPVLDTELLIPGSRARVAIISKPLSPTGVAYSIRRHRDKPWTLPLFIDNGMLSPLAAGLISFLIDGSRTMLIAGTRGSGKTSLLGSVLVEIMRKYRIISVEDSVTGDADILVCKDGKWQRMLIGSLIDSTLSNNATWYNLTGHEITGNLDNIQILAMDKKGKIIKATPTKFIRHKVSKPVYKITTRTGREVKVTGDHSLFGLDENAKISEIKASQLKVGDHIATPNKLDYNGKVVQSINLLDHLNKFNKCLIYGGNTKDFVEKYFTEISQLAKDHNYTKSIRFRWRRLGIIPITILEDMKVLGYNINELKDTYIKIKNSKKIPTKIDITNNLLTVLGLWLADGCYDRGSILLSSVTDEERAVINSFAQVYSIKPKLHSDGVTLILSSKPLKVVFSDVLELKGNAYTKRIPKWVFDLDKDQLAYLLKGVFSGDGHVSKSEIMLHLSSGGLLDDIQTLLLRFGIIHRIGKLRKDKTYSSSISCLDSITKFKKISMLQDYKRKNLDKLSSKSSTHDTTNILPLKKETKIRLSKLIQGFSYNDYVTRDYNLGMNKAIAMTKQLQIQDYLIDNISLLTQAGIFWDEVRSIEVIENFNDYVYDLSVPGCESFIAGNIVLHNTLELPVDSLRSLGFNIQNMKVRSALATTGSELSADEGIRVSLRLGDSSLIVGEIRSSIRGNEEVIIVEDGFTRRVKIKDLEGKDISNLYIPTMDLDLKFKLKKLLGFVKHPARKKLLIVETSTGRKVTVTEDHSLFTHKDFRIIPIECRHMKPGMKIIIPEKLPTNTSEPESINLLKILEDEKCRLVNYEEDLKIMIKKIGYKKASKIVVCSNDIYQYLRKGKQHTNLTIKDYNKLVKTTNHNVNIKNLKVKRGTSCVLDAEIPITNDLCRFLGYYCAEGWTDLNGDIVFSNGNEKIIRDIVNLSKSLFNIDPYIRQTKGIGISTQINLNNKMLGLMIKKLGAGRTSIEKRVPPLIYSLSEEKMCEFLKGYFDGDGSQTSVISSGNRIAASTVSEGLANDLLYLFLNLGIVAKCYTVKKTEKQLGKHISYVIEIKQRKYIELFLDRIGFKKYTKDIIKRGKPHSRFNTVNYNIKILEKNVKLGRKYRHLRKYSSCGKDYLKVIVKNSDYASDLIKRFVDGQFYLDEIKSIKELNLDSEEFVYDLSVEPGQNFIGGFGGIMLHNTEAFALYEAMRVGALANVVAGTIHGDSPYGVFDRVVNDLKVPRTSFKATDIIIVANPIKSPDGLHSSRKITQITEVRKHWDNDPLQEGGFIDLMKYDADTDSLVPTDDLINGNSEILKSIGGNVKEWAGSWDAIWDNILLRAKIKETLVNYSKQYENKAVLEADIIIHMNDEFHKICERVREKSGYLDSKKIFFEWEESLKKYLRHKFNL